MEVDGVYIKGKLARSRHVWTLGKIASTVSQCLNCNIYDTTITENPTNILLTPMSSRPNILMMELINTMESSIEVYVFLLMQSEEDQCVFNSRRDLHYKWVCPWTGEMTLEARERATLAGLVPTQQLTMVCKSSY